MNPAQTPAAIPHTLRLFKAEELAGQGLFREAEALLANGGGQPPEDPVLLHALAVVVTRQGDYERARRLWRLLQSRQPGHREAEAMLTAIDTWEERPTWVRFAPAAAAALVVFVLALVLWPSGPSTAPTAATPTTPPGYATAPVTPTLVTGVTPLAKVTPTPVPAAAQKPPQEEPPVVMFKLTPAKPAKK